MVKMVKMTYEQYLQFKELANESDVPETSLPCCQFLQTKFFLLDGQLLCLKNKTNKQHQQQQQQQNINLCSSKLIVLYFIEIYVKLLCS